MKVRIPMTETVHCLICHEHIGKGNDPAICKKQRCKDLFEYECAFNKFAKESTENLKEYGISPEDAQALESKKFTVTEIARMFNIPPHMLKDYE